MLYIVVFIVLVLIIVAVYFVRLAVARRQQHRNSHRSAEAGMAPSAERPTLRGVANDVSQRMFGQPEPAEPYVPFHRRSLGGGGVGGEAVTRAEGRSDPELPTYVESSLPAVPPPTYSGQLASRPMFAHELGQRSSRPMVSRDPPKYMNTSTVVTTAT